MADFPFKQKSYFFKPESFVQIKYFDGPNVQNKMRNVSLLFE